MAVGRSGRRTRAGRRSRKHGRQIASGAARSTSEAPRAQSRSRRMAACAVVTTAFYDRPGVAIVDLRGGRVSRVDAGPEPCAVAFAPDGDARLRERRQRGGHADCHRPGRRAGRTARRAVGRHARGAAITPDGEHAPGGVNGGRAVAFVDLERMTLLDRVRTLPFPREIAVSPDGQRALRDPQRLRRAPGHRRSTSGNGARRSGLRRRGPARLAFNRVRARGTGRTRRLRPVAISMAHSAAGGCGRCLSEAPRGGRRQRQQRLRGRPRERPASSAGRAALRERHPPPGPAGRRRGRRGHAGAARLGRARSAEAAGGGGSRTS